MDAIDCWKRQIMEGLESSLNSSKKLKWLNWSYHILVTLLDVSVKYNNAKKRWRQQEKKKTQQEMDLIKEVTALDLQDLSC